jgi:hypothetical protein
VCLSGFTRIDDGSNIHFRMEIPPDPIDELARIYARAAVDAFLEEQFSLGQESRATPRPGVCEVPAPSAVAQSERQQAAVRFPDP